MVESPRELDLSALELGRASRRVHASDVFEATATVDSDPRPVDVVRPRLYGDLESAASTYLDAVETWADVDDHEGVVTVLDWGTAADGPWVVTERAERTLRDRLDDGPLAPAAALSVARDCAAALAGLHERLVTHRALTPERVVFDGERALLADTGTGATLEESAGGLGALSTAYAAPEQFRPERFGGPDERTDVYRLGAVCYEALTGARPYDDADAALVERITDTGAGPVPASERRSDLPDGVDDLLATALSTEPSDRYATVAAFEAALAAVDAGAPTEPWRQCGRTAARTSHAAAAGPEPPVEPFWTVGTGYHEVLSAPVVADGTLYAGGDDDVLHAVDVDTGTESWTVDLPGVIDTAPAVADGTVFVPCGERLAALDAADGRVEWTFEADRIRTAPAVVDGVVYVGSDDRHAYALDADTGDVHWEYEADGRVVAAPAVADGVVYVASRDGTLAALDADTGDVAWETGDLGVVQATPAVRYGSVYVAADGAVNAVDTGDGRVRWAQDTAGTLRSPAVDGGSVFVGTEYEGLVALDADTGEETWRFEAPGETTAAAVTGGTVVVGSDGGTLYGVAAADGTEAWSLDLGEGVTTAPTLAGTDLFVGGADGSLLAVRGAGGETPSVEDGSGTHATGEPADAGTAGGGWTTPGATPARTRHVGGGGPDGRPGTRWKHDPEGALSSPILDSGGTAYVGEEDGTLRALDATTGETEWTATAADHESEVVTDGERVYAVADADLRMDGRTFDDDQQVFALDADTGEDAWTVECEGPALTPTVTGDTVYVADEWRLSALDAATGEQRWTDDRAVAHSPVASEGTVYVATEGTVAALDADTGIEQWTAEVPRYPVGAPALADGRLLVAIDEGDVVALDAATGETEWTTTVARGLDVGVAVADGTVYAGSENGVVTACSTAGERQWRADTGEPIKKPLAVAGGVVYASTRAATYALGADDGDERWQFRTVYASGPVVGDGAVLLVDESNVLRSLV